MLEVGDRSFLLTIDFEAFEARSLDLWLVAMERWAQNSRAGRWSFSIFIALEDVVRLRHDSPERYVEFLEQVSALGRSGARFYPHNHGFFNPETGRQASDRPQRVANYGKRASFFYDVVHRHGLDLHAWLLRLLGHYEEFLAQAGAQQPRHLAFRAGGWDHGTTSAENAAYVCAVSDAGFVYDSSASGGVFGTTSFRVGAPFGSNVSQLTPSLFEVAPCWAIDCGADLLSRSSLGSLRTLFPQPQVWLSRRAGGAFVTVLHFDHLFSSTGERSESASISEQTVLRRVDRFFEVISRIRSLFQLHDITFEQLNVLGENPNSPVP